MKARPHVVLRMLNDMLHKRFECLSEQRAFRKPHFEQSSPAMASSRTDQHSPLSRTSLTARSASVSLSALSAAAAHKTVSSPNSASSRLIGVLPFGSGWRARVTPLAQRRTVPASRRMLFRKLSGRAIRLCSRSSAQKALQRSGAPRGSPERRLSFSYDTSPLSSRPMKRPYDTASPTRSGLSESRIFSVSSRTRSALSDAHRAEHLLIAARVPSSISKPSCAETAARGKGAGRPRKTAPPGRRRIG